MYGEEKALKNHSENSGRQLPTPKVESAPGGVPAEATGAPEALLV